MLDKGRFVQYPLAMNRLSVEKRTQILGLLVEGTSLRATSRLADVSINTVTKLLVDAGRVCADTPAMAAGISDHVWSIEELVELLNGNASIAA